MRPSQIFRLTNTVQHYAWGSPTAIPELLGVPADGRPVAEMWLGAHALAPSRCVPQGAGGSAEDLHEGVEPVALPDLVRSAPYTTLGVAVVEEYGPRLPYLLKVLAADQPLSLQVHPKPHVARSGFSHENAAGVPLDAPERNYKDDQHKPEMMLALTPFEGLCGFRRPLRTLQLFDGLDGALLGSMRDALRASPDARGVRSAFELALAARGTDCTQDIETTVASIRARIARGGAGSRSGVVSRGDYTAVALAEHYPGDPGALVSLMLNRVSLQPGEAVFLASGEVHAYLSGLGIEVMASSDNVLRAGLTSKRVDVDALLACASYVPRPPERPVVVPGVVGQTLATYRAPVPEFSLMYGTVVGDALVAHTGPRIVLCLDGEVVVQSGASTAGPPARLRRGESAFVPHDAGAVALRGSGSVVVAYVP
ncbi:mannose-6-phosphate isomerase, class I [Sanguibacter antarcticus]|uniref:mannose-6-phosphate isomerase n=1 Tax=Sanguibacter antarcticus TaxID=372484 RepID=A0A2A9E0X6_9MICO|nr:mannose-6-phosphate isomerase, class I [Sanguibacter antarcticus]PFG32286.1 mannose-6-phosphate isomerase type 1 [Sanguibacter antarcticus]